AGGLGTGMNSSGYVDTKWAVEFSPAAAMSYRANHPDTIVYCQDSNLLLKHAIETREGKNPKPLVSNFSSKEKCKEMPRRGDVDFIFGGPPCQAFSGANHTPKADDIRTTLPCNMLSFVEEYDPDYFLLENVTGLLRYPLLATTDGRRLTGGIKMGVVKMIMRVLIALGYQVRFKILEAGQYGCPQSRKRIIFLGAKRGLKLPDFPIPTHAFTKACAWRVPCNPKKRLLPVTHSKDSESIEGGSYHYAPMNPISIKDAIGDLPAFEWKNPHHIIEATAKDRKEALSREEQGIKQVDAIRSGTKSSLPLPGFPRGAPYAKPPQNAYQKWMREKMKEGERVMDHVTKYHKANIVESTVTMPLEPDVHHTILPVVLQPPCARPGKKQADKVFYGRTNDSSFFRTALATSSPAMKDSWPLHPSQKRVYTIREAARSQGFPDHYKFLSEKKLPNGIAEDQQRQIGNAVPVPLALALGKALGDALKTMWKEKRKEGSPAI
ncbi:dna (cytosine-5)-methyltransferase -like, partial [Moniliophthora roreri MCA 2997]